MGQGASKAKLGRLSGEMLVAVASFLDNFNDLPVLAFAFALGRSNIVCAHRTS